MKTLSEGFWCEVTGAFTSGCHCENPIPAVVVSKKDYERHWINGFFEIFFWLALVATLGFALYSAIRYPDL